jgi:PPOX class probable F420-dependent enzyme
MERAVRDRVITQLESGRRAVLATVRDDGRPRLVPIAFAADTRVDPIVIYSAIDEKRKTTSDPRALGRVRDIQRRSDVSVLLDNWSEEWSELAWIRIDGTAMLLDPTLPAHTHEHALAVDLLRQRYPQYESQRLEHRPVIRIVVEHVSSWSAQG